MSEVFLVAWKRRAQVSFTSDGERVLPSLLGVAVNVLRNRRRSNRRAMAALARLNPRNLEADFTDDVDGRLSDERQMREVLGVLERLAGWAMRKRARRPGLALAVARCHPAPLRLRKLVAGAQMARTCDLQVVLGDARLRESAPSPPTGTARGGSAKLPASPI
jgi:hypothetical protein